MSHTRGAAQGGPGDARISEESHIGGPQEKDETDTIVGRGRRCYHLRPEPRRRTDLMGFSSTWWMVVVWLIVIS